MMEKEEIRTEKVYLKFPMDHAALFACLLGFVLWAYLLHLKYVLFAFCDWDMALYAQAMQSLCHGTSYASLFGTSFLVDHSHYIAFLLTPIYALFPHPLTLINLELLSFFGGGFVFYKIASKTVGEVTAFILMIIYLMHPANIFMLFFEFHFESLAPGFIFLMFYFYGEKKWVPFMITALIILLIKENMALIVAMFGVYGMLFNKENRWRWGGIVFCIGVLYFVVNMFVLIPYFRRDLVHSSSMYWVICYNHFGNTPQEILFNLFFHPIQALKGVCTAVNLNYIKNCIGPFLFLSIFGSQSLIGLPILAQNLLSSVPTLHTIYYHYAATLIPFAAMGALEALGFIKTRVRLGVFMVFVVLIAYTAGGFVSDYWLAWKYNIRSWDDSLASVRQSMIEQIPKDSSVVASFDFLSHLTDHKNLYAFYSVWRDANDFTGERPFKMPGNIQYALIDFDDPWLLAELHAHPREALSHMDKFFIRYKWKIKSRHGRIILFKR